MRPRPLVLFYTCTLLQDRARAMSGRRGEPFAAGQRYSACALSLVFHPRSPLVPTFRADVRYFEVRPTFVWLIGFAKRYCSDQYYSDRKVKELF